MAYVTGSVNSHADLVSAIQAACTANGWTLNGEVLSKGTAYFRLWTNGTLTFLQGGTGIDGSNNLTGAAPQYSFVGSIAGQAVTFPLTYQAFINASPDEVYVVLNYATDWYQWIMFGRSDITGLPGTGAWCSAPRWQNGGSDSRFLCDPSGGSTNVVYSGCAAFWHQSVSVNDRGVNSFVHHNVDGRGWGAVTTATDYCRSFGAIDTLLGKLPNAFNGETVLLPFQVWVPRTAGGTLSLIADLKNLRHCRNDNHLPGEIITIGLDRWKIFPWLRRDTVNRNGGAALHSGTVAFAVRYDGP